MILTKKLFSKAMSNSINNLLNACYLVYANQCDILHIEPISFERFGELANLELKKFYALDENNK